MIATTIKSSIREKPELHPIAVDFLLVKIITFSFHAAFYWPIPRRFRLRLFIASRANSKDYGGQTEFRPFAYKQ
jgi:hypothetical protein